MIPMSNKAKLEADKHEHKKALDYLRAGAEEKRKDEAHQVKMRGFSHGANNVQVMNQQKMNHQDAMHQLKLKQSDAEHKQKMKHKDHSQDTKTTMQVGKHNNAMGFESGTLSIPPLPSSVYNPGNSGYASGIESLPGPDMPDHVPMPNGSFNYGGTDTALDDVHHYARGARMVPRPTNPEAGPSDTVPAMLTPGEAVIPREAAQDPRLKPVVKQLINHGRQVQQMNRGGSVPPMHQMPDGTMMPGARHQYNNGTEEVDERQPSPPPPPPPPQLPEGLGLTKRGVKYDVPMSRDEQLRFTAQHVNGKPRVGVNYTYKFGNGTMSVPGYFEGTDEIGAAIMSAAAQPTAADIALEEENKKKLAAQTAPVPNKTLQQRMSDTYYANLKPVNLRAIDNKMMMDNQAAPSVSASTQPLPEVSQRDQQWLGAYNKREEAATDYKQQTKAIEKEIADLSKSITGRDSRIISALNPNYIAEAQQKIKDKEAQLAELKAGRVQAENIYNQTAPRLVVGRVGDQRAVARLEKEGKIPEGSSLRFQNAGLTAESTPVSTAPLAASTTPNEVPVDTTNEARQVAAAPEQNKSLTDRLNNAGAMVYYPGAEKLPGYEGTYTTADGRTFIKFNNSDSGLNAAVNQIDMYQNGKSAAYKAKHGDKPLTPETLIETWAPTGKENSKASTDNYKSFVASRLGIKAGDPIPNTPEARMIVAQAIKDFEGGTAGTLNKAAAPVPQLPAEQRLNQRVSDQEAAMANVGIPPINTATASTPASVDKGPPPEAVTTAATRVDAAATKVQPKNEFEWAGVFQGVLQTLAGALGFNEQEVKKLATIAAGSKMLGYSTKGSLTAAFKFANQAAEKRVTTEEARETARQTKQMDIDAKKVAAKEKADDRKWEVALKERGDIFDKIYSQTKDVRTATIVADAEMAYRLNGKYPEGYAPPKGVAVPTGSTDVGQEGIRFNDPALNTYGGTFTTDKVNIDGKTVERILYYKLGADGKIVTDDKGQPVREWQNKSDVVAMLTPMGGTLQGKPKTDTQKVEALRVWQGDLTKTVGDTAKQLADKSKGLPENLKTTIPAQLTSSGIRWFHDKYGDEILSNIGLQFEAEQVFNNGLSLWIKDVAANKKLDVNDLGGYMEKATLQYRTGLDPDGGYFKTKANSPMDTSALYTISQLSEKKAKAGLEKEVKEGKRDASSITPAAINSVATQQAALAKSIWTNPETESFLRQKYGATSTHSGFALMYRDLLEGKNPLDGMLKQKK